MVSYLQKEKHVSGVEDEDGSAVFEKSRGPDVLDFAEAAVEWAHDEILLAEEAIDDEAETGFRTAEEDDGDGAGGGGGVVLVKECAGGDEADLLTIDLCVGVAFK